MSDQPRPKGAIPAHFSAWFAAGTFLLALVGWQSWGLAWMRDVRQDVGEWIAPEPVEPELEPTRATSATLEGAVISPEEDGSVEVWYDNSYWASIHLDDLDKCTIVRERRKAPCRFRIETTEFAFTRSDPKGEFIAIDRSLNVPLGKKPPPRRLGARPTIADGNFSDAASPGPTSKD